MPATLVDSNVLVDFWNGDSRRHESARQIVEGIDTGTLPTGRVTDYVFLELLNLVHSRRRPDVAVETETRLDASAGFEVVHAGRDVFRQAVDVHERFDGLSFGDATVAAYMDRTSVEYLYSFDDDFDAVDWITRLRTAVDPYDA